LRQQDLRPIQDELLNRGLSSLGRCEGNVQATLNAVINALCRLYNTDAPPDTPAEISFHRSREILDDATTAMFGPPPPNGGAHIMVTMPSESAQDAELIHELVALGMTCMRINCAHDDPDAWRAMIRNLRTACSTQHRECQVMMDMGGPKLRTGPMRAGVAVLKWQPRRDELGRVMTPARICLQAQTNSTVIDQSADCVLPISEKWIRKLNVGDRVRLKDARGRKRTITITEVESDRAWGECRRTCYICPGTILKVRPKSSNAAPLQAEVGELPPGDSYIVLYRGDRLRLGAATRLGSAARYDDHGRLVQPAFIGCTLPSVLKDLRVADRVLFDDGRIDTRVIAVNERGAELEVTDAAENGSKLRADKGINLPDTNLHLSALTDQDLEDLKFIAEHADIVGYSFVRCSDDVEYLQEQLEALGRPKMPIMLKIENRQAFERLPSLLLSAMRSPVSGVMIARGDLAVELGWQRLAEVQEEILWMCEAAHMPVVWATQVLESLAKTGLPSRAEITDAAMGVRAECVMLNKGPHILEAVRVLSDILRRMHDHQVKKRPLLRRLRLADDLQPLCQQNSG